MTNVFVLLVLALVLWCLWIRRVTWGSFWETPATACVALCGFAALLLTPLCAKTFGVWLYDIFGMYDLQDFCGLDLVISATASLYCGVLMRIIPDINDFERTVFQRVMFPHIIIPQLMLFAFWRSATVDRFYTNILDTPLDWWLTVFWLLCCGALLYFMVLTAHGLLTLRHDPRSRRVANMFLASIAGGVLACGMRMVTLFVHRWHVSPQIVFLMCAAVSMLTFGCVHSWRTKVAWFSSR